MRKTKFETIQKSGIDNFAHNYGFSVIENFDDDRYKNLKKEFLDADKSKDGNLTMPELEKYLVYKCDRIGLEYRKLEVDDIFRKMDENKNGVVTLNEFTHYYYRQEDDYKIKKRMLELENDELRKEIDDLERDYNYNSKNLKASSAGVLHLHLLQGNFSSLDLPKEELKKYKMRIRIKYAKKEYFSKSISNEKRHIWNEIIPVKLEELLNLKFEVYLEQSECKKETYKLERIKDIAFQNLVYKSIDNLPFLPVSISMLRLNSSKEIGTLEIKFEFFNSEALHKNKLTFEKKEKISKNELSITENQKDFEYLSKLFGTPVPDDKPAPFLPPPSPPLPPPPPPPVQKIKVGFFDQFNLDMQPPLTDKQVLSFSKNPKIAYIEGYTTALFKYVPLVIACFSVLISFSRSDFLTLVIFSLILPYLKNGWCKSQCVTAFFILVINIFADAVWITIFSNVWGDENDYLREGQIVLDKIIWVFSLVNMIIKVFYLFLLFLLFNSNKFASNP